MVHDVELRVNGRVFSGWKTINVARDIDTVSGTFTLQVSDRWKGNDTPWEIAEGDECTLAANGETLITGYVDRRSLDIDANFHSLEVSGRDRTADLVDSSAVLDTWEFANQRVDAIARKIAAPFGVTVSVGSGLSIPAGPAKFAVHHGETAWDVIERAARLAGVLAMTDGRGGILLTRTPATRATTALVEGKNIEFGRASYDNAERYARYIVAAQSAGSDELSGAAVAHIQAEARDTNVRAARVLMLRGEGNLSISDAQKRANFEAVVRAARAGVANIGVQGWTQADGSLWPLNALVKVKSPHLALDGDMLIAGTVLTKDLSGGTMTELVLARPDAYIPEPLVEKGSDPQSGESIFS